MFHAAQEIGYLISRLDEKVSCKYSLQGWPKTSLRLIEREPNYFLTQTNNTEPTHFLKSSLKLGALQKEIDGVTEVLSHKPVFFVGGFLYPRLCRKSQGNQLLKL